MGDQTTINLGNLYRKMDWWKWSKKQWIGFIKPHFQTNPSQESYENLLKFANCFSKCSFIAHVQTLSPGSSLDLAGGRASQKGSEAAPLCCWGHRVKLDFKVVVPAEMATFLSSRTSWKHPKDAQEVTIMEYNGCFNCTVSPYWLLCLIRVSSVDASCWWCHQVKKKKARTTFAWLQTLVPSQMAVWRGGDTSTGLISRVSSSNRFLTFVF